ncbi:cupin domain-containing protein [Pseudonocardia eucalypti]|uniref:Cupin domain-containing protein n=1 Tax=Pseudonocardia eucalypti TaxID=648755 RepID=A0ABP9PP79_9PSEU|nr:putative RmlC-like cupin family protein [Pseudonocardia eucalypti]
MTTQNRVHHVRAGQLDGFTAISGERVGSSALWMGMVSNPPGSSTPNHHHGPTEAAVFVVSGHPVFYFHDGTGEVRVDAGPGDFLYVPPFVPHREENPDPDEPAVVVIARSSQEPVMVHLPELYHLESSRTPDEVGR